MTSITTNNQPRQLMYLWDFSEAEQQQIRSDFDWMDSEDLEYGCGFFRYRSSVYHLEDFMLFSSSSPGEFTGWHGYRSDSYFSGVLVRLTEDCDHVVVGRFCS